MEILVQEYDELWPAQFALLKERFEEALVGVPVISIEHVGSTSVPGLCAKPVIDIDIVVARKDCQAAILALVNQGFENRGDLGIEGRWAINVLGVPCKTNTYVVSVDSLALKNHLVVRDVLRRNSEIRNEYCAIKQMLAMESVDMKAYTSGKSEILQRVLNLGGLNSLELEEIARLNRN